MRRYFGNKNINIIANSRGLNENNKKNNKPQKKKIDFNAKKKATVNSLYEVENFLGDFKHLIKYVKLYYLFK